MLAMCRLAAEDVTCCAQYRNVSARRNLGQIIQGVAGGAT